MWDALIELNIEDWAGNYGPMPGGEHKNVLTFPSIQNLIDFLEKDLGPGIQVDAPAEAVR